MLASGPPKRTFGVAGTSQGTAARTAHPGPQHSGRCVCWRRYANVADEGQQSA